MTPGADRDPFLQYVLDQLREVEDVEPRSMFGGYGLYQRGRFFGIVHRGQLFLKTDETSRPRYKQHGMKPFRPSASQTIGSYYEVPADVLECPGELATWAQHAAALAGTQPMTAKPRRTKPSKRKPTQ